MIRFSPRKWDHITTCVPCLYEGHLGMIRSEVEEEGQLRGGERKPPFWRVRGEAIKRDKEAARCQLRGQRESSGDEAEDDLPEMEMEK